MTDTMAAAATLDSHLATLRTQVALLAAHTKDSLGGTTVRHLGDFLADYSGNLCVICGESGSRDLPLRHRDRLEVGHLISVDWIAEQSGKPHTQGKGDKGGYVAGCVAAQHKRCNNRLGTTETQWSNMLARPDLVPLTHPTVNKLGWHWA